MATTKKRQPFAKRAARQVTRAGGDPAKNATALYNQWRQLHGGLDTETFARLQGKGLLEGFDYAGGYRGGDVGRMINPLQAFGTGAAPGDIRAFEKQTGADAYSQLPPQFQQILANTSFAQQSASGAKPTPTPLPTDGAGTASIYDNPGYAGIRPGLLETLQQRFPNAQAISPLGGGQIGVTRGGGQQWVFDPATGGVKPAGPGGGPAQLGGPAGQIVNGLGVGTTPADFAQTQQGGQQGVTPMVAPGVPNAAAMGFQGPQGPGGLGNGGTGQGSPVAGQNAQGNGPGGGNQGNGLGNFGLPLSPAFEAQRRLLDDSLQAQLAQIAAQRATLQPQADVQLARLATEQGKAKDALDESLIGRGIYRSGIRNVDQGRLDTGYDRSRQDLSFNMAQFLSQLAGQETGAKLNYNQGLMEALIALANQQAADKYSALPSYNPNGLPGYPEVPVPEALPGQPQDPNAARIAALRSRVQNLLQGGVTPQERDRIQSIRSQIAGLRG